MVKANFAPWGKSTPRSKRKMERRKFVCARLCMCVTEGWREKVKETKRARDRCRDTENLSVRECAWVSGFGRTDKRWQRSWLPEVWYFNSMNQKRLQMNIYKAAVWRHTHTTKSKESVMSRQKYSHCWKVSLVTKRVWYSQKYTMNQTWYENGVLITFESGKIYFMSRNFKKLNQWMITFFTK